MTARTIVHQAPLSIGFPRPLRLLKERKEEKKEWNGVKETGVPGREERGERRGKEEGKDGGKERDTCIPVADSF